MSSWHSYPKIYNAGHREARDVFAHPVYLEEKVDGSQFSFGVFDGTLRVRSKGQEPAAPEALDKMFARAVESVRDREGVLRDGWTYRGEYLQKPKHNVLAYDRVPTGHVILFDVQPGEEAYLSPEEKRAEADRIGLECVPVLHTGLVTVDTIHALLDRQSVLGGQKIEGVVAKQVTVQLYGADKKALMAKHVSEAFKEVHKGEWRESNPTKHDILALLGTSLRTPARWNKAIQHLQERGELEGTLRDIGKLFKEVPADIRAECEDELKDALFRWAWPHLSRFATSGLAEHYKERLLTETLA